MTRSRSSKHSRCCLRLCVVPLIAENRSVRGDVIIVAWIYSFVRWLEENWWNFICSHFYILAAPHSFSPFFLFTFSKIQQQQNVVVIVMNENDTQWNPSSGCVYVKNVVGRFETLLKSLPRALDLDYLELRSAYLMLSCREWCHVTAWHLKW